jgi:hypothetical protein
MVSEARTRTDHSVTLTDLDPDTTYHFRVGSTDASSNATTEPPAIEAPLTFTTPALPPPSLVDTTVEDFGAGVRDGTYVPTLPVAR